MSDYTIEDARRDLRNLHELELRAPKSLAYDFTRETDKLLAYIESLQAENLKLDAQNAAFWTQSLEGAPPHLTADTFKRLNADNVRLQAENERLRERRRKDAQAIVDIAAENERLREQRTGGE